MEVKGIIIYLLCTAVLKLDVQTRTGAVPGILARLNSTVLSLMDHPGVGNVARQARYFDAELEQAIRLILTGQCSIF